MKVLLPIILLVLSFFFSAYGSEKCTNSINNVMEEYWNNNVSSESIDRAIKLCHGPATAGDVESQYDLSLLYLLKNDEKENDISFFWVSKAAKNNHAYAQFRLGNMYEKGDVAEINIIQAVKWYQKSAEQGEKLSINKLIQIYSNGKGQILADPEKVSYWKNKLSEL